MMKVRFVEQYFANGYFAETVVADGPWEARFRFCGKYGYSPQDVTVGSAIRVAGGQYWCSVGKQPSPFVNFPENMGVGDSATIPIESSLD